MHISHVCCDCLYHAIVAGSSHTSLMSSRSWTQHRVKFLSVAVLAQVSLAHDYCVLVLSSTTMIMVSNDPHGRANGRANGPHGRANGISADDLGDPTLSDDDSELDLPRGSMNSIRHGSSTNKERNAAIRAFAVSVVSLEEAVLQRDIDLALSFKPWIATTSRRDTRVRKLCVLIERKCRELAIRSNPSYDPDTLTRSQFEYLSHITTHWLKYTGLYTLHEIYGAVAALAAESIAKEKIAAFTATAMVASDAAIASHPRLG